MNEIKENKKTVAVAGHGQVPVVRMIVLPKRGQNGDPVVTIPKKLSDPFLRATVDLNPDGIFSKEFAEGYVKTYPGAYAIVADDYEANKNDYIIIETYLEPEISALVDKMDPDRKDVVFAFCKEINKMPDEKVKEMKDFAFEEMSKEKVTLLDEDDEDNSEKIKDPIKSIPEALKGKDTFTVKEISDETDISPMNVGKELKALFERGLVTKNDKVFTATEQLKTMLNEGTLTDGNQTNNGSGN